MPTHRRALRVAVAAVIATVACAEIKPVALPATHPASPLAEEAPLPPPPNLLAGEQIIDPHAPLEQTPPPPGRHHHGGSPAPDGGTTPEHSGHPHGGAP